MKPSAIVFLVFFSIVMVLFTLINFYIYIRGVQALSAFPSWIRSFKVTFWVLAFSYVAARFLERVWISPVSHVLTVVGSFWLAAMLYFFMIVVVVDLIRFSNIFLHFLPDLKPEVYSILKIKTLLVSVIVVSGILIIGHINALIPRIQRLDLNVNKKSAISQLSIVAVSDIHLGTVIGPGRLHKLVESINELNPDVVLLVGDIVDEDLGPVISQNTGAEFFKLQSKYGMYAITGNHEYIGGAEAAVKYLEEHGIRFIRDSIVVVDDAFQIAGRDDRSKSGFTRQPRKELSEIMAASKPDLPVILLDHQPFDLNQAVENKVDLQLSGHTHRGQLWPFNYITQKIFELDWGYKKIEDTHFYVSSGYGTWGPRIRLGNRPEIVQITLHFSN